MFEQQHIDYRDSNIRYLAVLYLRVSDVKQAIKGSGLQSQEIRGREYARFLGIPVVETCHDDGVSGKLLDRPDVQRMLKFLRKCPPGVRYVVIVDDISRLARDYRVHFDLRDAIEAAGALLESPSTVFKAVRDADSNYTEGIQALGAQHWREKNAETCRNRKWARLKGGYWPYKAPLGYKMKRIEGHGNLLVRDEPIASILQEGFEGYASGRFTSQSELKRYFEAQPEFPSRLPDGTICLQRVTDLISHPIYAGYVHCDLLGITLTKGQHEPLISLVTHEKMKARRDGTTIAPARKDLNRDFPLRGFVSCDCCGKPLRSAWSKGKYKEYAYYLCHTKGCDTYGKSIRKADIEGRFVELLKSLRPAPQLIALVKEMLLDAWNQRGEQLAETRKTLKRDLKALEKQVDTLLDRMVETTSPRAIQAFERKVDQLEHKKLLLAEQLENSATPKHTAGEMIELSLHFLLNPSKLWESGKLELQRLVLKLAFLEPLPYCRNEGYRTPKTTLPFKVLDCFFGSDCKMVRAAGVEPARAKP